VLISSFPGLLWSARTSARESCDLACPRIRRERRHDSANTRIARAIPCRIRQSGKRRCVDAVAALPCAASRRADCAPCRSWVP